MGLGRYAWALGINEETDTSNTDKGLKKDDLGILNPLSEDELDNDVQLAPPAEVIQSTDEELMPLIDFVDSKREQIDNAYDFTVIFLDTEKEKSKFRLRQAGVALISTDLRKTVFTLKSDPLVTAFDNSKTLKRVSDWKQMDLGIDEFGKEVWVSVYISSKQPSLYDPDIDNDLDESGGLGEGEYRLDAIAFEGETLSHKETGNTYEIVRRDNKLGLIVKLKK